MIGVLVVAFRCRVIVAIACILIVSDVATFICGILIIVSTVRRRFVVLLVIVSAPIHIIVAILDVFLFVIFNNIILVISIVVVVVLVVILAVEVVDVIALIFVLIVIILLTLVTAVFLERVRGAITGIGMT